MNPTQFGTLISTLKDNNISIKELEEMIPYLKVVFAGTAPIPFCDYDYRDDNLVLPRQMPFEEKKEIVGHLIQQRIDAKLIKECIVAIKYCRNLTGMGLSESKDFVVANFPSLFLRK